MSINKDELLRDLAELKKTHYSAPEKSFDVEELAVKQTLEKMVYFLSRPKGVTYKAPVPSVKSIEHMTQKGQLSLVAKAMDDQFMKSVKSIILKGKITFDYNGKKLSVLELYERCYGDLKSIHEKEPEFGDVLLRMYTTPTTFYSKLNAILSGSTKYDISEEERVFSFIFNAALHKAGLDKAHRELQETPEIIYRGQNFGLNDVVEKFTKMQQLFKDGKLHHLSPNELASINIADMASKKMFSTTIDENVAKSYGDTGMVISIKNPQDVAEFYDVANISYFPKESEVLSRIPDDVAMIPVDMHIEHGITHIEVFCLRSQNVLLDNSKRFDELKNQILISIDKATTQKPQPFKKTELALLKKFDTLINHSTSQFDTKNAQDQMTFLKEASNLLACLYKTPMNPAKKDALDVINLHFQDYAAAFAQLKVVSDRIYGDELKNHTIHSLRSSIQGVERWLKQLDDQRKQVFDEHLASAFKYCQNPDASPDDIKSACTRMLACMDDTPGLAKLFPKFETRLKELCSSCDTLMKIDKNSSETNNPMLQTVSFKKKMSSFIKKQSTSEKFDLKQEKTMDHK